MHLHPIAYLKSFKFLCMIIQACFILRFDSCFKVKVSVKGNKKFYKKPNVRRASPWMRYSRSLKVWEPIFCEHCLITPPLPPTIIRE